MEIRRVRADEWEALRDLRLRALEDAPDAFATTLDEARGDTDEDWRDWCLAAARSDRSAVFVAVDFDGMAGGFVREEGDVLLFGMWVAPERRGSGLADALVEAVLEWSRSLGMPRVALWVVDGNVRAERFYRRLGFEPTGVRKPLRDAFDSELALRL
jgi:GNAT superfamily N-acetyltransferase